VLAIGIGDIHATLTFTIRVEGDAASVGRRTHVIVVRRVVHDLRDLQDGAAAVGIGAHQRARAVVRHLIETSPFRRCRTPASR
jgi:hypothetical protein